MTKRVIEIKSTARVSDDVKDMIYMKIRYVFSEGFDFQLSYRLYACRPKRLLTHEFEQLTKFN